MGVQSQATWWYKSTHAWVSLPDQRSSLALNSAPVWKGRWNRVRRFQMEWWPCWQEWNGRGTFMDDSGQRNSGNTLSDVYKGIIIMQAMILVKCEMKKEKDTFTPTCFILIEWEKIKYTSLAWHHRVKVRSGSFFLCSAFMWYLILLQQEWITLIKEERIFEN